MPLDRKRLLGYVETIQLILGVTDKVFFYQLPLILTALFHVDPINVAYLTACAFIRS